MTIFQSVSSSSHLQNQTVILTSLQVKNIATVPITLAPVPVGGKLIVPYFMSMELIYGGTSAFTASTSSILNVSYYDGVTAYFIDNPPNQISFMESTTTTYFPGIPLFGANFYLPAQCENLPVVLENLAGGVNFGGNAANDNMLKIHLQYVIIF